MSNTINIKEILAKQGLLGDYEQYPDFKTAIQEIAEAIVDKYAEDAKSKRGQHQHYVVDKQSIEHVKQLTIYE